MSEAGVVLVGMPNVGKSTLFNAMTGSDVMMGNWPGTTVEVEQGHWRFQADRPGCDCGLCDGSGGVRRHQVGVADYPGAYSLSIDPGWEGVEPDVFVAVVDAAHLARSLYLVADLRERSHRLVVALTMTDVAVRRGISVDIAALADGLGVPVVVVNPRKRTGLDELALAVLESLREPVPQPRFRCGGAEDPAFGRMTSGMTIDDSLERADERFAWIADVVSAAVTTSEPPAQHASDKLDRVLMAPVVGPVIFLVVMWTVFQITTNVAAPLQNLLSGFFAGPVSEWASALMAAPGAGGTWVEGLVVHGIIAGVGMVLSFIPLLGLMFVLLALLEDSGYLARAAVMTDRAMRVLGLPGRAFLPLVVGFGCNVPAVTATRVLGVSRQRLMTVLLVPFTACTARLTVFVMMGTIFFGRWAGTAVFGMYVLSIALVMLAGLILRVTVGRTLMDEPLIIELPPYHVPTLRITAQVAWSRLRGFLQSASGILVAAVIGVWLIQAIPVGPGSFGHVAVEHSLYAWLARGLAPVFALAGFGAWETVGALVAGFVAKEAIISSWGQTYAVATSADMSSIGEQLRATFEAASGGHTMAAVVAFMVFLVAYTPCVATMTQQRREVGWRWTAASVVFQLTLATILAIVTFQVGRLVS